MDTEKEIKTVLYKAYQLLKGSPSHKEVRFALSYKLGWFTPTEADLLIEKAVENNLLFRDEKGTLSLTFDTLPEDVALDYTPPEELKTELKERKNLPDASSSESMTPFRERLVNAMKKNIPEELGTLYDRARLLQERHLLDEDTSLLMVAAEKGMDVALFAREHADNMVKKTGGGKIFEHAG